MNVDELKSLILTSDIETFVDEVVLGGSSPNFSVENIGWVHRALSSKFSLQVDIEGIYVVGSAKLGYGLFEKKLSTDSVLPAFREFRPDSDIDIAIVSQPLFEIIWHELSTYANSKPWMPWDSGKLGDYLIYGWLRPDLFPKGVRLRKCDDWWDTFRALSADSRLGRRTVRGALYYSLEHLKRYQVRGLNKCRKRLEVQS